MSNPQKIDLHAIARIAMAQYGFEPKFPGEAIREAESFNEEKIVKAQSAASRDLRGLLWSSIDNADSLDLDQLEYAELGPDQAINVKVAIADVDAFVAQQSAIDKHAAHNGTSVYTGIETFSMLPARLSTELTSLLDGQDRLAVVIEYSVRADGEIIPGQIYRALVRNKAKLVYEEIGDWLEGKGPEPETVRKTQGLEEQLRLQEEAAKRLQDFRMQQGALELETIEARAVVRDGLVVDLIVPQDNQARHIIENFMIAANRTMVNFLKNANVAMIQRVVRTPKDWQGIVATAGALGESLPAQPDARALSEFLIRQKEKDPEHFPDLSLTIVKLLGSGEYLTLEPDQSPYGHFGLAVMDYTHSTAPNRRFVDVLIQRLVKSVFDRAAVPYTVKELSDFAASCTDRDQSAKKVERFMRKASAAVLLAGRIGEVFDAIVTGASPKGFYCRIKAPPAEGRIMAGGDGVVVGQKIRVKLIGLDPTKGFIDFERLPAAGLARG